MKLLTRVTAVCAATALCVIPFAGPGTAQEDVTGEVTADDVLEILDSLEAEEDPAPEAPATVADTVTEDTSELTDAEIIEQALTGVAPAAPGESPEFLALAEAINSELDTTFIASELVWDPEKMAFFDLPNADPDFLPPLDEEKCATGFEKSGALPEANGEVPDVLIMCSPITDAAEQLAWLQSHPSTDLVIKRTYVDHIERDGVIYTSLVWAP